MLISHLEIAFLIAIRRRDATHYLRYQFSPFTSLCESPALLSHLFALLSPTVSHAFTNGDLPVVFQFPIYTFLLSLCQTSHALTELPLSVMQIPFIPTARVSQFGRGCSY